MKETGVLTLCTGYNRDWANTIPANVFALLEQLTYFPPFTVLIPLQKNTTNRRIPISPGFDLVDPILPYTVRKSVVNVSRRFWIIRSSLKVFVSIADDVKSRQRK